MSNDNRSGAARSAQKSHADLIAEIRMEGNTPREIISPDGYGGYETITIDRDEYLLAIADQLEAAYKREMDEAAYYINDYLNEIPSLPKAHNWLIRNGYKDTSYQESLYGQEIVEVKK